MLSLILLLVLVGIAAYFRSPAWLISLAAVVGLALGVVLFFPGTISDIPAVNLVWFVVKCALFMLFTLTVVKSATGRLRIEQALSFFLKYPAGLALLSLILVWIGC